MRIKKSQMLPSIGDSMKKKHDCWSNSYFLMPLKETLLAFHILQFLLVDFLLFLLLFFSLPSKFILLTLMYFQLFVCGSATDILKMNPRLEISTSFYAYRISTRMQSSSNSVNSHSKVMFSRSLQL